MKKALLFACISLVFCFAANAFAQSDILRMRRMADSEFRIAEKAFKEAETEYGPALTGIPAEEKMVLCKRIRTALYDNRVQYNFEDLIAQMKYKRQIQKLESYQSAANCGN
ncbi:hypothetical protein [Pseudodesulfovibrio sp. zrk46]|uniref:hypothetical protein n=1 Tax=Pseudodesulfovibrio sp. zrk46 TaxID=2725288 RepID=UPI001449D85A|nr:hypothetical protein [Pseudodesulfovibrio sp. zrk46]QJB57979.1 hypothetical protein HFN16_17000 [Pseudodesulfovibrio sp. zrk46]